MTFVKTELRLSPEKVFQEEDPTIVVSSPAWRPSNVFGTFCTFILLLLFLILLFGIFYICTFIPCFYYLELFVPVYCCYFFGTHYCCFLSRLATNYCIFHALTSPGWISLWISSLLHCKALFQSLTFPSPRFPTNFLNLQVVALFIFAASFSIIKNVTPPSLEWVVLSLFDQIWSFSGFSFNNCQWPVNLMHTLFFWLLRNSASIIHWLSSSIFNVRSLFVPHR